MTFLQKSERSSSLVLLISLVYLSGTSIIEFPTVLSSTTNRNSYNAYNYDQTDQQFSPDGRLLQVEYASVATCLSPPLVVLECFSSLHPCVILLTQKRKNSPHSRIVIIEDNKSDDQNLKKGRPNSIPPGYSYCCVMSGILSDSLCLLQAGMKAAENYSLQYQASMGIASLTRALADECQSRVFAGGLRPYGTSFLLCGYDRMSCNNNNRLEVKCTDESNNGSSKTIESCQRKSSIYQIDPSGGIIKYHAQQGNGSVKLNQSGKSLMHKNVGDECNDTIIQSIVGGTPGFQRQLRNRINQRMTELFEKHNGGRVLSMKERIANVAKVFLEEMKHGSESKVPSCIPLEIVVMSPILGCHRLDNEQIRAIQNLTAE